MEEKCVCSVQIWKEVFDHFDRQPKKIETNENYSIDEDAKEKRMVTMSESDTAGKLDESVIKQLTGGEERMAVY